MRRVRLTIEYDGSRFAGWQIQPRQMTVQQRLQEAIETVVRHPVLLMGAGRTDSGVHARGQVAAFDWEPSEGQVDLRRLEQSLNGLLGGEVAVRDLRVVASDFQPRHDARERRYSYTLLLRRSPLREPMGWFLRVRWLDVEAMRQEAELFLGTHDFLPFSFPRPGQENTFCTVKKLQIVECGAGELRVEIAANRFLHHMVRAVVGHLVDVGKGMLAVGSAAAILRGEMAGPRRWAPPQGLVLEEVLYADELKRGE